MIIILSLFMAEALAKDWTNNSIVKKGNILTIVAEGTAPSLDLARKDAINSAKRGALDFLPTKFKARSLSVETEKSVSYHSQTESEAVVKYLLCEPLNEKYEEKNDSFHLFIECKFDLRKVKIEESEIKNPVRNSLSNLSTPQSKNLKTDSAINIKSDSKLMTITTIPKCSSIIITGEKPRTLICNSNVMSVLVEKADKEIIVRADFKVAKRIQINELLRSKNETLQVLLEDSP